MLSTAGPLRQEATDMMPALPAALPDGRQADLVVIHKSVRRMVLSRDGRVLATYRVALGFDPIGHKRREGDGRTPEGRYIIDGRNPRSRFHLSLHVSYPAPPDVAAARTAGVDPGGDIMIHGQPNGRGWLAFWRQRRDWTAGCVAVTDKEIREIWSLVPDGTTVVIHP
ncbi:MAG: L,D-transpeptidase family protein [Alphaproteobacteria bacterium]|nr:L,D-transpeptidase family protein [Alphaproteobacteria bacterium]